jgi:hypothetical protein
MLIRRQTAIQITIVQVLCLVLVGVGAFLQASSAGFRESTEITSASHIVIPRTTPLVIEPFYDDPEVVSDEELAMVLRKIQPRFSHDQLKPNYVEHALRAWSLQAKFRDPMVLSGADLAEFLTDHGKYLSSWGEKTAPLLEERSGGVGVRWGKETGASVHHDHWLASLTEAGISIDSEVFTPTRRDRTIRNVLTQAMLDFRVDETEVEWSALAFGLWTPPVSKWVNGQGRVNSYDLLAERLMRGHQKQGVCSGTHRVYSLMVLVRLDAMHQILSPAVRQASLDHLAMVRDMISVSQFEDGHWPSNWAEGKEAVEKPIADELFKQVIATGHHLEWLAIAPKDLHPDHAQILKASRWLIKTTAEQSQDDILQKYTFFSHVGNALSLWRKTRPSRFWAEWEAEHAEEGVAQQAE